MKCTFCNYEAPKDAVFCQRCSAVLPKRTPVADFIMQALKCAGFFGFWMAVQVVFTVIYTLSVSISVALDNNTAGMNTDELTGLLFDNLSKGINVIYIVSAVLTVVSFILFYKVTRRDIRHEMSAYKINAPVIAAAVACGFFLQIVVCVVITFVFPVETQNAQNEAYELIMGGSLFWQILNIAIVTPFIEECVFRSIIYRRLRLVAPKWAAVALSSLFFGAMHGSLVAFCYATVIGVVFALAYERTRSVFTSFLIHVGFNGASFLVGYIFFNESPAYIIPLFVASFVLAAGSAVYLALYAHHSESAPEITEVIPPSPRKLKWNPYAYQYAYSPAAQYQYPYAPQYPPPFTPYQPYYPAQQYQQYPAQPTPPPMQPPYQQYPYALPQPMQPPMQYQTPQPMQRPIPPKEESVQKEVEASDSTSDM